MKPESKLETFKVERFSPASGLWMLLAGTGESNLSVAQLRMQQAQNRFPNHQHRLVRKTIITEVVEAADLPRTRHG